MSTYQKFMRIGYLVSWPFSAVLMHNSKRVRVLILSEDKILLQRSSFGHQKWSLPGGGINRKETPLSAAIRETEEEVGLKLSKPKMRCLGSKRIASGRWFPVVNITAFAVRIKTPTPPTITRKHEVLEADWFTLQNMPENLSKTVTILLEMARKSM